MALTLYPCSSVLNASLDISENFYRIRLANLQLIWRSRGATVEVEKARNRLRFLLPPLTLSPLLLCLRCRRRNPYLCLAFQREHPYPASYTPRYTIPHWESMPPTTDRCNCTRALCFPHNKKPWIT